MHRILTGLCCLLLAAAALADDLTVRPYKPSDAEKAYLAAIEAADDFETQKAVALDYQAKHPQDMVVQLRAASLLATANLDSTRAYYVRWAEREPQNEVAVYMAGRLSPTPEEQQQRAQQLLERNPNSYWGHLLLASSFTPQADPGYTQTEAELRKAIAADNSLPFAVERLGHMHRTRGEMEQADATYAKLSGMLPERIEPLQYRLQLVQGDYDKALKLIDEFLERNPKSINGLYLKARAQREKAEWPAHIATMQKVWATELKAEHAYDLACGFSLGGYTDSAFVYLFKAVDLGFADMEQYKSDEDLVPLRLEPRWNELLVKVEAGEQTRRAEEAKLAAATAPQRKEKAVAERQSLPAPDFTLQDLDGNTVTLSELKGKVVVLDFWATWCGPCKKSMPLINQFFTGKKSDDVRVYGVNVWERGGTEKVKPFIEQAGYQFPILYGKAETAQAYGVQGIPTMVVIDKEGKIAYRHIGFDPTLIDILTWQTEELLK